MLENGSTTDASAHRYAAGSVDSTDEDSSSAPGWSIDDGAFLRASSSGRWASRNFILRFKIRGTVVNTAATGTPGISGTKRVGNTLVATTGDIADADGLPATFPDDYDLEWLRVDGTTVTTVSTASEYLVQDADEGLTLKLKVSFTDDHGYSEALTSDATSTIAAKPSNGCTSTALRLYDGDRSANNTEGDVEICYNNSWRPVCDDRWDKTDAEVACRQLGYATVRTLDRPYVGLQPVEEDRRGTLPARFLAEDAVTLPLAGAHDEGMLAARIEAATGLGVRFVGAARENTGAAFGAPDGLSPTGSIWSGPLDRLLDTWTQAAGHAWRYDADARRIEIVRSLTAVFRVNALAGSERHGASSSTQDQAGEDGREPARRDTRARGC